MLQRLEEVAPPLKPIAITTSSGSTGLLLGSDEMQHEVVETLAAFKATNTGSWRELAESPSVSDQHKVLIAHAGVEIKLAKRAWQAHTAAELAARESFAEELQAFSLSVMSAAKQAARERALAARAAKMAVAQAEEVEEADMEEDVLRAGREADPQPVAEAVRPAAAIDHAGSAAVPPQQQRKTSSVARNNNSDRASHPCGGSTLAAGASGRAERRERRRWEATPAAPEAVSTLDTTSSSGSGTLVRGRSASASPRVGINSDSRSSSSGISGSSSRKLVTVSAPGPPSRQPSSATGRQTPSIKGVFTAGVFAASSRQSSSHEPVDDFVWTTDTPPSLSRSGLSAPSAAEENAEGGTSGFGDGLRLLRAPEAAKAPPSSGPRLLRSTAAAATEAASAALSRAYDPSWVVGRYVETAAAAHALRCGKSAANPADASYAYARQVVRQSMALEPRALAAAAAIRAVNQVTQAFVAAA